MCPAGVGMTTSSASVASVLCGKGLRETGTGFPDRGHGGDAPRKKRNLSGNPFSAGQWLARNAQLVKTVFETRFQTPLARGNGWHIMTSHVSGSVA